jgi:hypothetical protein
MVDIVVEFPDKTAWSWESERQLLLDAASKHSDIPTLRLRGWVFRFKVENRTGDDRLWDEDGFQQVIRQQGTIDQGPCCPCLSDMRVPDTDEPRWNGEYTCILLTSWVGVGSEHEPEDILVGMVLDPDNESGVYRRIGIMYIPYPSGWFEKQKRRDWWWDKRGVSLVVPGIEALGIGTWEEIELR